MRRGFAAFAKRINSFSATPMATVISFALILAWLFTGPIFHWSDTFQLVANTFTSLVTFVMVFILNNAQSRDTGAINAKLDEIILKMEETDNALIGIEHDPDFEVNKPGGDAQ